MDTAQWEAAAAELGRLLLARRTFLATAESCTGGLIAGALTAVSGSSEWFAGGVVAYANSVKEGLLGVDPGILAEHGAVSEATVLAMAAGVAALLKVGASVAVSGIAGPTGGTPDKPVGTVWLAWSVGGRADAEKFLFAGSRDQVRAQSVQAAIKGLIQRLGERPGQEGGS